jgi:membrane AbrB-like protein
MASAVGVVILRFLRLPAALLLGPMAAGIVIAVLGGTPKIAPWGFQLSQALIGCMIARAMPDSIGGQLAKHAPIFLISTFGVLAVSGSLGWLLTRWRIFPGTTAVWGSWPGAATAMVLLSDVHGADARLVAVMQYMRVMLVAVVASVVARIAIVPTGAAAAVPQSAGIHWLPLTEGLAIVFAGFFIARWTRLTAGALLVPLVLSFALQRTGLVHIELPQSILAVGYAVIGWSVGLRFNRPILRYAAGRLPWIIASSLLLIAACGVIAVALDKVTGMGLLAAYLATSPGGADSIAIIAASGHVDMGFVMAFQTSRFVAILLVGSRLARFIARHAVPSDGKTSHA